MKTLHMTNAWHERSGGIATFYRALMRGANQRGQHIRLVVPGKQHQMEECGEFGRIYYVASPAAKFNPAYRAIYPPQYLWPGSPLQEILRKEKPDLVEVCDKYTLNYLSALLRLGLLESMDFRPVTVGLSCERMDDNFRAYIGRIPLANAFCSGYMKWAYYPFFDHHIANSGYTAAELQQASVGHLVPRATWTRPMGVDLSFVSPARRSAELRAGLLSKFGASPKSVLLLYVGRLVPEKNLALLFDLLRFLVNRGDRDYRLLVAGDGIESSRWETASHAEMPGHVKFLGHVTDRNALADLYANADMFVHPNPREPFGIAPLEAMASGLPLLAPNRGGVTAYANSENAWLTEATVGAFAAALDQALSDPARRQAKARLACQDAQKFSWEAVTASFLDLYAELVSSRKAGIMPGYDFCSTPATGLRQGLSRAVAGTASRAFLMSSRIMAHRERSKRKFLPSTDAA